MADLVILLFDGSKRLAKEDEILMRKLDKKRVVAVINKADLKQNIERDKILRRFRHAVDISAKKFKNINLLEESIVNLVNKGEVSIPESVTVSNLRHICSVKEAQKLIAESLNSLDNKLSLEFIAQNIKDALSNLDDILGRKYSKDLLDRIFSQFCIGK